jgi:predicted RNA binding protein YcfA (HicA-like mRNA interferase family)
LKGFGKEVRERLSKAGWEFLRHGKGDHDMWHNPVTGQKVTVPVNLKSRHTANDILKDAGLPKIGA